MPKINLTYTKVAADAKKYGKGYSFNTLSLEEFNSFNYNVLELGNLSTEGTYIQALAVFLDLEGFTNFCNQIDSHLVIPEFTRRYLEWLFQTISNLSKEGEKNKRVQLWGKLPFYAKFIGDGVLFLWDTDKQGFSSICNIISNLYKVTQQYEQDFIPLIQQHVSKPPNKLRCGIARGQIISLGNGQDYVGSCINSASRLQKLSKLSFAISRRGFDLSQNNHHIKNLLILKRTQIRGIGEEELIWILKKEFDNLSDREKKLFKAP